MRRLAATVGYAAVIIGGAWLTFVSAWLWNVERHGTGPSQTG